MKKDFTPEQIEKAKAAKSAEELLSIAKETGIDLTEEQAGAYFEKLNGSGELSDNELDNVAGGGCYDRKPENAVNENDRCRYWLCKQCGKDRFTVEKDSLGKHSHFGKSIIWQCRDCKFYYYDYTGDCYCCSNYRRA